SRVGDLEVALEHVLGVDLVEELSVRVRAWIIRVHAVNRLSHQQDLAADLEGALGCGGVRGEVGHAHASTEDDHTPLLEVAVRTQREVGLGDLSHLNGSLHAAVHALLLQEVLQGQAIHDGAQHAHVVGAGTVEAALLQLRAAEEVPTTDDHGHLHAAVSDFSDLACHVLNDIWVDAHGSPTEHLTAQLQHNPLKTG